MSEKPILFSGPMVRAILEGRKTQTRRVIKPQPVWKEREGLTCPGWSWELKKPYCRMNGWVSTETFAVELSKRSQVVPGDRLWVREAWRVFGGREYEYQQDREAVIYREGAELVDSVQGPWRPSIHMPRWASRLTLEVTGVRVERLQEISEADAIAEGIERCDCNISAVQSDLVNHSMECDRFARLWDSINKKTHPWESNPWVWVYEFKRLEAK